MEQISVKDIGDVTSNARLQQSHLKNLYVELGLEANEIENAERNADTNDVKLQAASVLLSWRRSRGSDATRQAIIEALVKCRCREAVMILQVSRIGLHHKSVSAPSSSRNGIYPSDVISDSIEIWAS